MDLIDMHCDTISECYLQGYGLHSNSGHIDLHELERAGALAQFFAIFIPSHEAAREANIALSPYPLFAEMYQTYLGEIEKNSDRISSAVSYADIVKNKQDGKISSILTIEDGELLEGRLDRLEEVYEKGVRLITLTWNYENCIGFPHSANQSRHKKGLKPFGIQVVEKMNEKGMLIDVSHLSEGGFYDVARYSKKPFVASHSCARSLCDSSRNLTDDQLRCIGETGGVAGVNFNASFLRDGAVYSTIEDIVSHVEYMVNCAGSDSVALGSDFDGIDCELEIDGYGQYAKLISALHEKFSASVVEKICNKNVLRVLRECL